MFVEWVDGQWDKWVGAVAVGALFAFILRGFYRAFESRWPDHYFGGAAGVDPVISRTPTRYLMFRLGPVFLAALAAGTAAHRIDHSRGVAVTATVVIHILTSVGVGLYRAVRGPNRNLGLFAYRLMATIGCLAVGACALLVQGRLDKFVPDSQEVAFGFWVALAVFAVGYLGRSMTGRRPDAQELLRRTRDEVAEELLEPLDHVTSHPPLALKAIAYAEAINRPLWVRRMERLVLRGSGTFGLMQMHAHRPISDEESVAMFLDCLPTYPDLSSEPRQTDLRAFFLAHNDDAAFADLATALFHVMSWERDFADAAASDEPAEGPLAQLSDGESERSTRPLTALASAAPAAVLGMVLGWAWARRGRPRSFV